MGETKTQGTSLHSKKAHSTSSSSSSSSSSLSSQKKRTHAISVGGRANEVVDAKGLTSLLSPKGKEQVPSGTLNLKESEEMSLKYNASSGHTEVVEVAKEQEVISFDEGPTKVENKLIGMKKNVHIYHELESGYSVEEWSARDQSLKEMHERMKSLQLYLEKLDTEIKFSEIEKSKLQKEFAFMKEKLVERTRFSIDLELKQKYLNEKLEYAEQQIKEYEQMYYSQSEVLQSALNSQDAFQCELLDAKEAAKRLTVELEFSRRKTEELEEEMACLRGEAQKALELQSLLEKTNLDARKMEHKVVSLEEQLSELYKQIDEHKQEECTVENALSELSVVRAELNLSKMHEADLEQKIASSERVLVEVKEQLHLRIASEERLKQEVFELKKSFAKCQEEHQSKVIEFEELDWKLMEEVKKTILLESNLKRQEARNLTIEEEMSTMSKMKADAEATISTLNTQLHHMQKLVIDLENKLKVSACKSVESNSHLEEAMSRCDELELKLNSLQELYGESELRASIATKLNLEYQSIVQVSNSAKEAAELKLRITDTELVHLRQKNMELEEQINDSIARSAEVDKVVFELKERTFELSKMLEKVEEENKVLKNQITEHRDKIVYLESSLKQSSLRNCELEEEMKVVTERCLEQENQALAIHKKYLELQYLIKISNAKAEDAGKRNRELELLLRNSEEKQIELEKQCRTMETKYMEVKTESEKYFSKVSEVSAELEISLAKISKLEVSLQNTEEKELESTESIRELWEEKNKLLKEISHLELTLDQSTLKIKELESDLIVSTEKCVEHEGRANVIHQRCLELEELICISNTKAETAETKVAEMEIVMKSSNMKVHELEECIRSVETKLLISKQECERYESKVFKISHDLEVSLAKVSCMELAQHDLKKEKTELKEQFTLITVEKENFEKKVKHLEIELKKSTFMNDQLEEELKVITEKCTSYECHANRSHEKCLELEGLIRIANCKAEEAEAKYEKYASKVIKLSKELEISIARVSSLEFELHEASTKETLLREQIAIIMEEKLKLEEKFMQLECEIQQSCSRKLEIEHELKVVKKKLTDHEELANKNQQRCLELEYQIKISDSKAKEEGRKVVDLELLLKAIEQKKIDLEEDYRCMKTKYMELEIECKQYTTKLSEVSVELEASSAKILSLEVSLESAKQKEVKFMESRRELMEERSKFSEKVTQFELALRESSVKIKELEKSLVIASEKCVEYEGRINVSQQRCLELEKLMIISHSKVENAEKSVVELEILLKSSKEKEHELEECTRSTEVKLLNAKEECEIYSSKVSTLSQDLQVSLAKVSSLERAWHDSERKEIMLKEHLSLAREEQKNLKSKIKQVESYLNQSTFRNLELEQELKVVTEKCTKSETCANISDQRCLELEGLIEIATSKAKHEEAKFERYIVETSKLSEELKVSLEKLSSVELALCEANTKETMLREHLSIILAEQEKFKGRISQLEFDLEQSLSIKSELQQELKVLGMKCIEMEAKIEASHQRCVELELQIQISDTKAKSEARKVVEIELLLENSKQEQCELHKQCRSMETKYMEMRNESKENHSKLSEVSIELEVSLEKIFNLEVSLQSAKTKEMEYTECVKQLVEEKKKVSNEIIHIESTLYQSKVKIKELESELAAALEKRVEHESRANISQHKCLELESLIQTSRSKTEIAEKRVVELEILLKNSRLKKHELEQHIRLIESKFMDAKKERETYAFKVSKLSQELEITLAKVSRLEMSRHESDKKEGKLKENLALIMAEQERFEKKIKQLECNLSQSTSRNLELEQELKALIEKCTDYEFRSEKKLQRKFELEGLIQNASFKIEGVKEKYEEDDSKVAELSQGLEVSRAEANMKVTQELAERHSHMPHNSGTMEQHIHAFTMTIDESTGGHEMDGQNFHSQISVEDPVTSFKEQENEGTEKSSGELDIEKPSSSRRKREARRKHWLLRQLTGKKV
ncbi:uncharacterized protein LOC116267664 [Nymphaea colorata]|nr:uncharacterized protein LOC116267664 [Nymphaea colorata]